MHLVRIDGRYRLQERIAVGSCGQYAALILHLYSTHDHTAEVYLGHDILSGRDVAIKLEPMRGTYCTLPHEFCVYKKLAGGTGIPRVSWFGTEGGYNAMVLDRLGPSLEDLFVRNHFRFSFKTISMLATQLVSRM